MQQTSSKRWSMKRLDWVIAVALYDHFGIGYFINLFKPKVSTVVPVASTTHFCFDLGISLSKHQWMFSGGMHLNVVAMVDMIMISLRREIIIGYTWVSHLCVEEEQDVLRSCSSHSRVILLGIELLAKRYYWLKHQHQVWHSGIRKNTFHRLET